MTVTKELNKNVSRREFLAGASGVIAVGYLVVDCSGATRSPDGPAAGKNWTVTVTVDESTTPPTISYSVPGVSDPTQLPVLPGDTVTWVAQTNQTHNHLVILFLDDTPFVHPNGKLVYAFHGSNSDVVGKDASIKTGVQTYDSWEYFVALWDGDGSPTVATATGEPTIIIGKGMANLDSVTAGVASAKAKSIAARRLLERAEKGCHEKDLKKLKSIVGELDKLIDKWKILLEQGK